MTSALLPHEIGESPTSHFGMYKLGAAYLFMTSVRVSRSAFSSLLHSRIPRAPFARSLCSYNIASMAQLHPASTPAPLYLTGNKTGLQEFLRKYDVSTVYAPKV